MHSHKIIRIYPPNFTLQNSISKELGVSKILSQILINRGITDIDSAEKFIKVSTRNFHDPYSFSDMHKAVEIIKKAQKNSENVLVCGDYDVDGITALALIKGTLQKAGHKVLHYLPHRIKDGYGLNKSVIHFAKQNNVKVLITVDCGTSNHEEIGELNKQGIDVIITDHHELAGNILPQASAIINPKVHNSGYAYRDLAGVGVAYKFAQAFCNSMLLDDLDLVSLGTIADSVPLTGENRLIAKEGLARFPQTKRPGLQVLMEKAGIQNKKFTSQFISFILGPRINAAGRMDTAETSLNLLMSQDKEEAGILAKCIEDHNRQRQKVEGKIFKEAEDLINREVNFKEHKVIVVAKEDWHQGVLGIVASKLADRFYRPAIVISLTDDLCKGSARSIKNFHLFDAIKDCSNYLDAFGGHSHAAGLLIKRDSIDGFRNNINRLAHERLSIEDLLPSLEVDIEVNLGQLNEVVAGELERLEPFGMGNPAPVFFTRNLKIKGQPQTLSRETLKFWVTDGNVTFQAIGFGMSNLRESFIAASDFDLVYALKLDTWLEEPSVILEVKDVFFR
ncbi:MAG: single-stranded-DNA-specific exonuclease RecJ [Candidatus Omnitrophica bacterium]|nr:single-stranded-DNA-specific exonuclease RecJ [Candidatus Omnitrophota bacterium]